MNQIQLIGDKLNREESTLLATRHLELEKTQSSRVVGRRVVWGSKQATGNAPRRRPNKVGAAASKCRLHVADYCLGFVLRRFQFRMRRATLW